MIGIIGGVGPYAGIDLVKKIFDQTFAKKDQDHLPLILLSDPNQITDRTEYLFGRVEINPGEALGDIACKLSDIGALVIGIPCNTAHAPEIFNIIRLRLREHSKSTILVNMIDEIGKYVNEHHSNVKNVGILSTTGTYKTNIYPNMLRKYNINAIQVDEETQNRFVHPAIYNPIYGIKSNSNPIKKKAYMNLHKAALELIRKDAGIIILGCSEIPLAITESYIDKTPIVDATRILARALINYVAPEKLRK